MRKKLEGGAVLAKKRWTVPLGHPSYVIERCPNPACGYPEADGGHCPECGTTRHGLGCRCKDR